jgi:hypothetical protein
MNEDGNQWNKEGIDGVVSLLQTAVPRTADLPLPPLGTENRAFERLGAPFQDSCALWTSWFPAMMSGTIHAWCMLVCGHGLALVVDLTFESSQYISLRIGPHYQVS